MLLVSVLVFSNMWLSKKNLEYGLFGACTPELSSWCSVWCSSTPKATHQRFQWIKSAKFRSWIHFLNFMSTNFAADLTSSGLGAVASFWCIAGLATFSLTCVVFLSTSCYHMIWHIPYYSKYIFNLYGLHDTTCQNSMLRSSYSVCGCSAIRDKLPPTLYSRYDLSK